MTNRCGITVTWFTVYDNKYRLSRETKHFHMSQSGLTVLSTRLWKVLVLQWMCSACMHTQHSWSCKWHWNLQPTHKSNAMKSKQENLIWLSFVTFIIMEGSKKLADLQPDHENTAGNKYGSLGKYFNKVNRWMFRHTHACDPMEDKVISSCHVFIWTMGFQQVPVCLADNVPFYLMVQYEYR